MPLADTYYNARNNPDLNLYSSRVGQAQAEQNYDPSLAQAQKAEAMKATRAYELINIVQNLEHLRTRLISVDCCDHAHTLNLMIVSLMQQWTNERMSL